MTSCRRTRPGVAPASRSSPNSRLRRATTNANVDAVTKTATNAETPCGRAQHRPHRDHRLGVALRARVGQAPCRAGQDLRPVADHLAYGGGRCVDAHRVRREMITVDGAQRCELAQQFFVHRLWIGNLLRSVGSVRAAVDLNGQGVVWHDHDGLCGEPLRLARRRIGGRREPQPRARDQGHPERDGDERSREEVAGVSAGSPRRW